MIESIPGANFVHKHLSAENRLAEIICAIVMVLSFTATTSATFEGTTPHALLIAVMGCNIAWGIVDGVTYVLGNLLNRGARARLIDSLKQNPGDPDANAEVARRLDSVLGTMLTPTQMDQLRGWVIEGAGKAEPEPTGLRWTDILTGIACFLTVFGATVPLLIPFWLIENESLALRVSNGLMLAILFGVGWRWAKKVNISPWKTGFSLLGMGLVLVVITIALGG